MKARFELDHAADAHASKKRNADPESVDPKFIEPEYIDLDSDTESYDASEHHFAISMEKTTGESSQFIVNQQHAGSQDSETLNRCEGISAAPDATRSSVRQGIQLTSSAQAESVGFPEVPIDQPQTKPEDSWRQEVSARLSKYQARRRIREPRYPSLRLKFDPSDAWHSVPGVSVNSTPALNTSALAKNAVMDPVQTEVRPPSLRVQVSETVSRVIEFPRSSIAPPVHADELAEPVFDRPRIMEAPDIVPAPPALGGILIEPTQTPANEKRPGYEMPLQAAKMGRRLAATLVDGTIAFAGLLLFGYIFWQLTALIPPIRFAVPVVAVVAAVLWVGYQYLLVVHCGTTPGLKLAKLELSNFDGSTVPRKMRRWRVLASILSGLSLGLGYAWCFLDEDQLCWHDRITRTYIAPV